MPPVPTLKLCSTLSPEGAATRHRSRIEHCHPGRRQWAGGGWYRVAPCGTPHPVSTPNSATDVSEHRPTRPALHQQASSHPPITAVSGNALYLGSGHTIRRIDAHRPPVLLADTINSICGIAIDHATSCSPGALVQSRRESHSTARP